MLKKTLILVFIILSGCSQQSKREKYMDGLRIISNDPVAYRILENQMQWQALKEKQKKYADKNN